MERLSPSKPRQTKDALCQTARPATGCEGLAANNWPQTTGCKRLAARGFDRQLAEFQIRVAVLNGFTALGIPVIEAREYLRPQKGKP